MIVFSFESVIAGVFLVFALNLVLKDFFYKRNSRFDWILYVGHNTPFLTYLTT